LTTADEVAALYDLRARVLRPGKPAESARYPGDDDPATVHLGAFLGGRCVGIASLYPEQGIRLRGMAVEPDVRGRGVGAAVVRAAQRRAAEAGEDLWCSARASARGFYEKLGWAVEGEPFEIAGIGPHFRMHWRPGWRVQGNPEDPEDTKAYDP
jgi:GNAT superfamily N-acetyltransferase